VADDEGSLLLPGAVAPDGETLAVVLRHGGRLRLHVVRADGSLPRPLSDAVDVRGAPDWSPDGRWIAVGGSDASGEALFRVPVDGGPPERLVDGAALNPVWSPRGDLIVYAGRQVTGLHALTAVNLRDGSRKELEGIELTRLSSQCQFMPDGSGIVYLQGITPNQQFWRLDLNTRKKTCLTTFEHMDRIADFDIDPSGRRIVFDRHEPDSDVVLIELPGR